MTVPDRDLFISHSSGDAETARDLRAVLEAAGYTCWMAPDDVVGTDPWAEQILTAIQSSRAMLVLISAHSNRSPHVSREVGLAASRKRAVVPVRIEDVPLEASLEYFLSSVQRLDAFPPPIAAHRDRILRRLSSIVPVRDRDPGSDTKTFAPASDAGPVTPAPDGSDLATEAMATVTGEPLGPAKEVPSAPAGEASAPAPERPFAGVEASAPGFEATLGPGTRIAGFAIVETLGEGGMATVYRATQDEPRRSVALKVIRADHAADPAYRQRFLTEKDTLAALEHQSIVPIYAAGEASGVLYIAMRLVDGPDLATRLTRSGRLTLAETVATLRPIAGAVDYAHEMGVVHRDLKPSNIILDRRGQPYLTDFGLGKNLDKPRDLSVPGIALGTLDYMAPEQFSGLVDPALAGRTDVYALACVAFTCLTGAPPFRADEPERVMYGHLHGEPASVRDARPDLPGAVDTVIRRGLAKNPADRYATADAFMAALAAADTLGTQQTAPIVIPPSRGPRRISAWVRANGLLAGSIATVGALVVVGTGLAFWPGSTTSSPGPSGSQVASVGATTAPSASQVGPPSATTPPSPSTPPTATPPPTPTPRPTPTHDNKAPTGGKVQINDGAAVTTSGTVTVKVTTKPTDTSKIANYVWSTSSTRPTSGVKPYDASFSATVSTGTAGSRRIYVWFQDGEGNWSTTPATDTIIFDHAPTTVNNYVDDLDPPYWCGVSQIIYTVIGFAASDPDGNSTLTLVDVWTAIDDNHSYPILEGTKFQFTNPVPVSESSYTFTYLVRDEHEVEAQNTIKIKLGPCAPP